MKLAWWWIEMNNNKLKWLVTDKTVKEKQQIKWNKFRCSIFGNITSRVLPIPDICHRHHRRCLWRKICHVEKISPQDRLSCGEIFHMTNRQLEKCLHMVDMEKYGEKSVMWRYFFTWEMWTQICFVTILAVLSRNLFYCHIRCFAAKDILSRFMRFCVEKNLTKKLCLWRKMDKYQVW